jgi:hypothetical protein
MKAALRPTIISIASSPTVISGQSPSKTAPNTELKVSVHLISINMNPAAEPTFTFCIVREVEQCRHMSYVLNATARGQSPALRVAVWAAGPIRAWSSVSAHNAMEAVDVAAMFAAVVQKSIRTLPGNLSSTPPDSFE